MNSNSQGKGLAGFACWLLSHAGAAAVLLFVLMGVVPTYAVSFADLAVNLPVAAQVAIGVSRWVCTYWWLIIPVGCADAGILFGLRSLPAGARWLSTAWSVLVLVTAILLASLTLLAVAVPCSNLVQSLK